MFRPKQCPLARNFIFRKSQKCVAIFFLCGLDVLNSTKRRNKNILAWIYCWGDRIDDD